MKVLNVKAMAEIEVNPQEHKKIVQQLTLRSKFSEEEVRLYRKAGEESRLFVPRGTITSMPVEQREWEEISHEFRGELRPLQEGIEEATLVHLETNNGGIIRADTGTGKTIVATSIATKIGYKTLIVVPTSYLMDQWIDRIKQFTSCTQVGKIVQNTCDYSNEFTVGMIHSLSKIGKYPEEMYKTFGLVIWDEVHRLGAPTFAESACMFWSDYRLGLSATPRRKDGLENVFRYHIGREVPFHISQIIKPKIIALHYHGLDSESYSCTFGGKLNMGMYASKISKSINRNILLTSAIENAFKKDRKVLVLMDRINHIHTIKEMLQERGVHDDNIGIFTGLVKSGLNRSIILATYGSAGLGADLPSLDTLVLASPRADVEQAVGRILRGSCKNHPVVVDIVDNASLIMRKWYGARRKFYASKESELVER